MNSTILKANDIKILNGCSVQTAYTLIKNIKASVGKTKEQSITIQDYCNYENVHINEVIEFLKLD